MDKTRCDIIIPVWNAPRYTRECVESILRHTEHPYRIVIVDNASHKETKEYIDSLSDNARVCLIRNKENLGFVKAVNQGMRFSDARYVCVLNNDTSVARGWLDEAVKIFEANADVGLINPASNNLGVNIPQGADIDRFAESLYRESSKFMELGAAIGFCMFIRREVIDKIGYLDEIFGMGNFEDTDYSRRAVDAGFKCVMAKASYVYHKQSASFKKIRTFDRDFKRNQDIYNKRWGRARRILYILNKGSDDELSKDIRELAEKGNWIYIFYKDENIKIIEHGNIRFTRISGFFRPICLFNIFFRKKGFDEIRTKDRALGNILNNLRFVRNTQVSIR